MDRDMLTAKQRILARLAQARTPLAVHEIRLDGVSDNAAATRLSELQRAGRVIGVYRPGKPFKEWALCP